MNIFPSLPEYEQFVYTLQERYPSIRRSTLTVIRRGTITARLTGELEIGDYRIFVREKLFFVGKTGRIIRYGYEVGEVPLNFIGMIHKVTPTTLIWHLLTHTTSTFIPTSSTTEFPRLISHLPDPTCRFSSGRLNNFQKTNLFLPPATPATN